MKKNEEDKVKEPFTPEDTPTPPQYIDPVRREDNANKREASGPENSNKKQQPGNPESKPSGELLDEKADIQDEITI